MKAYFDIEHLPFGETVLVSVGIVRDDGETLHLVSDGFDPEDIDHGWFFKRKIWRSIKDEPRQPLSDIARQVGEFVADAELIVTREGGRDRKHLEALIGPFPYADINRIWEDKGRPELPKRDRRPHNALADARWHQQLYQNLEAA